MTFKGIFYSTLSVVTMLGLWAGTKYTADSQSEPTHTVLLTISILYTCCATLLCIRNTARIVTEQDNFVADGFYTRLEENPIAAANLNHASLPIIQ